jgi:hypothetical protein
MFAERVWKHHWFKVHVMNDMTVARAWMVRANGFIRVVTIFRRVHSPAQGLFIIQEPIRRGLLECHTHERCGNARSIVTTDSSTRSIVKRKVLKVRTKLEENSEKLHLRHRAT